MRKLKLTFLLLQFVLIASALQAGTGRILTLTLNIEGLYDKITNTMVGDTVQVYLRDDDSPYQLIDSAKAYVNASGVGIFIFTNIFNLDDFRMVVTHRNSIEIWGYEAFFVNDTLSYDFTTSASQAYGGNLKLRGDEYCIYSGDVDQDGTIGLTDESLIDNDANIFAEGYIPADLNGDGLVDISDIAIVGNNASHFISVVKPPYENIHTPVITIANATINGEAANWITCFQFFNLPVGAVFECDFISTDPDFEDELDDSAYFSPRDFNTIPTEFNATLIFTPPLAHEGESPLLTHMYLQFNTHYIGYIKWESYDLADNEERCVLFFNYFDTNSLKKLNTNF